jgi:hypothetical protein
MTGTDSVYVVHWPEKGIVKIGYSAVQRWRRFVFSGADVIKVYEFDSGSDALHIEDWLHQSARALLVPAFSAATDEARILLGGNGAGYCECWMASLDDVYRVIEDSHARAHAQADAQASEPSTATDVTDERTDADGFSPTRDIRPSVTRTRTYGISIGDQP